jgi:hypothetical protein
MFYIRDCNDQIVGNPNGYATMRGAEAQYANHRSKVYRAIWAAVDARKAAEAAADIPLDQRATRICSISMEGDE